MEPADPCSWLACDMAISYFFYIILYYFTLVYIILNYFTLFYIISHYFILFLFCVIINRFMIFRCLRRKETWYLVFATRISRTAQSETQARAQKNKNLVTFHKQE